MKGKIQTIYREGLSTVYNYVCRGGEGAFSFLVEHRYHLDILEHKGDPVGRKVEYDDEIDPLAVRFLDWSNSILKSSPR